ncbi:hypothetical protein DIS24_g10160 [Lasiodiplodia hormozganensis]|uniref:Uncharacterized protein n=1 Tax=Lasiodiplodia hormozganensis TaxID=869390 RepID=A0AA39XS30_9PEZI|nr:hypothetical protein DIS24_g10160 [Lasiodiplodia hormozganensis]
MLPPPQHTVISPFQADISHSEGDVATSIDSCQPSSLAGLLPAVFRSRDTNLTTPPRKIDDFLEADLSVPKLNDIHSWLLIVGRPVPPRPLNHQILIGRNIVVTEQAELHLVWAKHRIFIKPLPRYLLDLSFWNDYLVCPAKSPGSGSSSPNIWKCENNPECHRREKLAALARGFLFSYTALVQHESDFRIAIDQGLLPSTVTWESWKMVAADVLENHTYAAVNPRYWYGELRLTRLNKIYRFRYGKIFRAYSTVGFYNSSGDFFADNLGKLAVFLGYVVMVLTAMQVGLATDKLQPDVAFQRASYGFTVFSILAPILALGIIIAVFACLSFTNWTETCDFQKKRFRDMGVSNKDKPVLNTD